MKGPVQAVFSKFHLVLLLAFFALQFTFAKKLSAAPPLPAGTYTVGPSAATYTTLSNAISAINTGGGISGPIVLELTAAYSPTSETLISITGASATNTITIRPVLGSTKSISSSSAATPTFQINGGRFYIIDGRAGGVGSNKDLTIINTNNGGFAIRFQDGGSNNVIRNCAIRGANTGPTDAIILFGTSMAGSSGNDDNTITNCDISSASAGSLATNGIYSAGTNAARANDNNTISNCNIFDIFNATAKSVSILMAANTVGWTINGNSFFQTSTRTTSSIWEAIEISNKTTGSGFTISNNYVGGSAPLSLGATMNFTFTGSGSFSAVSIYGFSGTANVVSGNTIKNISITCNQRNVHYGIFHSDGTIDITNNTVGDLTSTGSIVFNSNAPTVAFVSPSFSAICGGGGSTSGNVGGKVNILNNNIGSITSNATGTGANEFRGIFYQCTSNLAAASIVDITGNTVGGLIANSLFNSGNGATVGIVINSSYIAGGAKHIVKDNTVQNLSSSNSTALPNGSLEGITTQGIANKDAAYIVENNTIKDLTANNAYTMVGFKTSATIAPQIITKNKISNLQNKSSLSGANVVGIELGYDFITLAPAPSAIASELSRNIITNLEMTAATPATGAVAWGISAYAGRFNIINNMVAMGYGINAANITKSYEVIGISNNGVGATKLSYFNFYYNTVHIGGTGAVSGSPDSKCYYGNNFGLAELKNNIFFNSRSNATGSTAHYSLLYTNKATTTSDYNLLSATGATGIVAGFNNGVSTTNYATTDLLSASKSIDGNSFSATVKFENSAIDLRPVPSPDVSNFFIANEALPITGITTDIDGNTRNTYFPDMGCYEFKGTGCWIGQNSNAWNDNTISGNWDDGVVPPSNWDVKIFPRVNAALKQPIILSTTGIATVKDLYLRTTTRTTTDSSLVTVNTGVLQIYGAVKFRKNIVFSRAIDARLGTIDMKGFTGTQTLSPRWFVKTEIQTLTNSNTTGLTIAAPTLSDTMLISKTLDYGVGTTGSTINTNDNLTLLSRATGTANFGSVTNNAITGKVNVERFLFAQKAWRFLATPVQISTSPNVTASWRESNSALTGTGYGTAITGPQGPNADLDYYTTFPSLKYYKDTINNWVGISKSNTDKIANNQGYMVFVRGDRGAPNTVGGAGDSSNLRIKGDIRTGNQVFTIMPGSFQSFGNPYPSQIDFRTVTKVRIANAVTIWNPTDPGKFGVGAYETYIWNGTNYNKAFTTLNRNFIESGEAVFIQSNDIVTGGSVTIKESDKATGTSLVSRSENLEPTLEIGMFSKTADGIEYLADGAILNFNNNYSSTTDNNDVRKSINTYDNLAIKNGSFNLVADRRPNPTFSDSIQLSITRMRMASYRLEIKQSANTFDAMTALLVDRFLNKETELNNLGNTSIPFEITNEAASSAANRFLIVFKPALIVNFTTIAANRNTDKTITVNFAVQNEKQVANYDIEQSNDGVNFTRITIKAPQRNDGTNVNYNYQDVTATKAANWYRVKANNLNGTNKYTAIAYVIAETATEENLISKISIYPNPVQDKIINLHFENKTTGNYFIKIVNTIGQVIKSETIKISNSNEQHRVKLDNVMNGSYNAIITDETGKQTSVAFMIK